MDTSHTPQSVSELLILCRLGLREDFDFELARLAATMAPPLGGSDSKALIEKALSLREAAALRASVRLKELLAKCPDDFLNEAHVLLKPKCSGPPTPSDEILRSEIRNEFIRRSKERTQPMHQTREDSVAAVEKDSRTIRPALPCGRPEALRWVISVPEKFPSSNIRAAFLKWMITRVRETHPELHGKKLTKAAETILEEHWGEDCTCDLETLAELCCGFRKFWLAGDFEGEHRMKMKFENEISAKRKVAGRAGARKSAETKTRHRWLSLAETFRRWADSESRKPDAKMVEDFITNCAPSFAKMAGKDDFFGAMLQANGRPATQRDLWRVFQTCGLNIPQSVAEECFAAIFA